jgi:protein-arginine kinase activator protein McsA
VTQDWSEGPNGRSAEELLENVLPNKTGKKRSILTQSQESSACDSCFASTREQATVQRIME